VSPTLSIRRSYPCCLARHAHELVYSVYGRRARVVVAFDKVPYVVRAPRIILVKVTAYPAEVKLTTEDAIMVEDGLETHKLR